MISPLMFLCYCWVFIIVKAKAQYNIEVMENVKDIILFNITYDGSTECVVTKLDLAQSPWSDRFNAGPTTQLSGQYMSEVTLVRALDYERIPFLTIQPVVHCESTSDQIALPLRFIRVIDVRDSPPTFPPGTYTVSVPEDEASNSVIISNIMAADEDTNDRITYTVNFSENQLHLFDKNFTVRQVNGFSREVVDIILIAPLDYETTTQYTFTVTAEDLMNMTSTATILIQVMNVQDTPPYFTMPLYSGIISELAAIGTTVLSVTAMDGDSSAFKNEIVYSIIEGPGDVFAIHSTTGAITVFGDLDVDTNQELQMGLITLKIQATETNSSAMSQYGDSTATVNVQIQVTDVNDNLPVFNAKSYTSSIREDAVVGELMAIDEGSYISVSDIDQSPNNNAFILHLEQNGTLWPVFETNIKSQFAQASVLIRLKEPDYLKGLGGKHLRFQIVATDATHLSDNPLSSAAEVLVWVLSPIPAAEAVLDLPIRTSDIVIFIIGFLILFNMILTFFLCYLWKRKNNVDFGSFNNRYYVSERENIRHPDFKTSDKEEDIANKKDTSVIIPQINSSILCTAVLEECTDGANYTTDGHKEILQNKKESTVSTTGITSSRLSEHVNNTLSMNQKDQTRVKKIKDRCDVTPLKAASNLSKPTSSVLKDRKKDTFAIPQTTENDTGNSTSEIILSEEPQKVSSEFRCDITPHGSSKASLSNLLQKVHEKLSQSRSMSNLKFDTCDIRPITDGSTSNSIDSSLSPSVNSSFSEKKCDVIPLIHSTKPQKKTSDLNKPESSYSNPALSMSVTSDRDSKSPEHKEEASNMTKKIHLKVTSAKSSSTIKVGQSTSKECPATVDFTANNDIPASTTNLVTSLLPTPTPSQIQLTQTGVPPIALALPFSTATIKNETQKTFINPIYKEGPAMKTNFAVNSDSEAKAVNPTDDHQTRTGDNIQDQNWAKGEINRFCYKNHPSQNIKSSESSTPTASDQAAESTEVYSKNKIPKMTDEMKKKELEVNNLGNSSSQNFVTAAKSMLELVQKTSPPTSNRSKSETRISKQKADI